MLHYPTKETDVLYFKQYYLGCLSHASYLIGDTTSGRAVVVDPQRDISQYLEDAAANSLAIEKVLETHFHADFLSGHLELAEETGASIVYGAAAEGRAEFPIEAAADGQRFSLGEVDLEVLATPGHTPESVCIVVRESAGAEVPYGVLTGDTLFIGDVGRPDLLSSVGVAADDLARLLYDSLHTKLLTLPDATRVFPAHGAGSACGKNLSTETVSTIGEQRRTNYALAPMTADQFVHAVTEGQAAAPLYFAFAANKNRQAHSTLHEEDALVALSLDEVLAKQAEGAAVLDTRDANDFGAAHLRGSINVGLGGRFAEYAGEVIRAGTPILLVTEPGHEQEARIRLARIGFDTLLGVLDQGAAAFMERPEAISAGRRITAAELAAWKAAQPDLCIVDVRARGEFATGAIVGAVNIPVAELLTRMGELQSTATTVVHCAGGYRSSIAASTLRLHGFSDVSDLLGGFTAWEAAGLPVQVPAAAGRRAQ